MLQKVKNKIKKICPGCVPIYKAIRDNTSKTCNKVMNLCDSPVIVLLYHRVADLESDPQLLAVSIKKFEKQIKFLKENYPILRFEDEWENIKRPSIVITFDDGYVDNYINALPILEKYQVPVTIFVSTGNINTSTEFWWDDLERLLLLNNNLPEKYSVMTSKGNIILLLDTKDNVFSSYNQMHLILKSLQAPERTSVLKNMERDLNPNILPRKLYRTMSVDELIKIDQSLYVTIGGHTISHTQLSVQEKKVQMMEIEQSKSELERLLNRKLKSFSYPFGGKLDYTSETINVLKKSGYEKVASNYGGQIHSWSKNRFEIPRYLVRNWNEETFRRNLLWYFINNK